MLKVVCLCLAVAGCTSASIAQDLGVSDGSAECADLGPSPEGKPCVTDQDCPARVSGPTCASYYVCAYPIADGCAATGRCMALHVPTCAHETYLCGCNGAVVDDSDCRYASGYASGPTVGGPHVASDAVCVEDGGTHD